MTCLDAPRNGGSATAVASRTASGGWSDSPREDRGASGLPPWKKHEQSNPPTARLGRRGGHQYPLRAKMARLRAGLRPLTRGRVRQCGHARLGGAVAIVAREGARPAYRGLAVCGSVWECPYCQMRIKRERADEVSKAVEHHGRDRVALLTLTVRHGRGNDLRVLRRGVANAYRALARGAPWRRFSQRAGLAGSIRALEVTCGPNGFHPHLHVLMFLKSPWASDASPFDPAIEAWLTARWQDVVARHIGRDFVPNPEHAAVATACHNATYIAKLGLEVSDPGLKYGRNGHRSPLEVGADWVETGSPADAAIWRAYCEGMRGARMLTWSRGLKRRAGIVERSDIEVASTDDEPAAATLLTIPGRTWDRLRETWIDGMPGPHWLLDVVERDGAGAAARALDALAFSAAPATRSPPMAPASAGAFVSVTET